MYSNKNTMLRITVAQSYVLLHWEIDYRKIIGIFHRTDDTTRVIHH